MEFLSCQIRAPVTPDRRMIPLRKLTPLAGRLNTVKRGILAVFKKELIPQRRRGTYSPGEKIINSVKKGLFCLFIISRKRQWRIRKRLTRGSQTIWTLLNGYIFSI